MTVQYNATVTQRTDLVDGTMMIRVQPDDGPFPCEPGQYTILGLKQGDARVVGTPGDIPAVAQLSGDFLIRRAYSITAAHDSGEVEFLITLVGTGALTPRLFNLRKGGRLFMEPRASGIFTLGHSSGNRDLLLIATGSALAPYLHMLRDELGERQDQLTVIVHAAAVSWDLTFRGALEERAERYPNFSYFPTITDPGRDPRWGGRTGPVEALIKGGELEQELGLPLSPDRFDVFLSGSPTMIDPVTAELEALGFSIGPTTSPETSIFVERYSW